MLVECYSLCTFLSKYFRPGLINIKSVTCPGTKSIAVKYRGVKYLPFNFNTIFFSTILGISILIYLESVKGSLGTF